MDQKLPRPPVCSRGSDKALFELRPPRPSALHRPAPPPELKKKVAQVRRAMDPSILRLASWSLKTSIFL